MNQKNGLLAFLCVAIAVTCAALQLPVVSGIEELGRVFAGAPPELLPPLAIHLASPTTSPSLPIASAVALPLTLYELRRDHRADPEIEQLAKALSLPPAILRAHLIRTSRGILGPDGLFWSELPGGIPAEGQEGLVKTRAAAKVLAQLVRDTGSVFGGLTAWEIGTSRAKRVVDRSGEGLDDMLSGLRRHLLAMHRDRAQTWLCTVTGLASALEARWPVDEVAVRGREGMGVQLSARPGEPVAAPLAGRVGFAGPNGSRGNCVELRHACGLRSIVCGLDQADVSAGQHLGAGEPLGRAGALSPRLHMYLDELELDPAGLALQPDGMPPPPPERAPTEADADPDAEE